MKSWAVPLACAAAFAAIWALDANVALFRALNSLGAPQALWANITVLGDTVVAFALCLPLWRRRPDLLWAVVFVALLGTLWVHGLKPLFDIPRPPGVLPDVNVIGPSYKAHTFPSGHATTAFAIGGLYALGLQFRTGYVIFLSAASVAALSRAVVGVHWPLDILAGAFGGWLAAVIAIRLAQKTLPFGKKEWVQWLIALFLAGCALWLVIGHEKSGYPQADLVQRAIGICCLAAAGARLKRAPA